MKKIALSLVTIAFVALLATSATRAYLSDQVSATGNTIAAGTLGLQVNGSHNTATHVFHVTNLVPGGWTTAQGAGGVALKNVGTTTGHAWFEIINVQTTGGSGDGSLANLVQPIIELNDSPYGHVYTPAGYSLSQLAGYHVDIADLAPGQTVDIFAYNLWPNGTPAVDNAAQGQSITYDVVFHLDQKI